MRGQGVRKDARNGQRLRPWGMGEARTWDAGGVPRVHTYKQFNPILALLSGRFEARVYASEKGSRIQLKRLPDHGGPPQHGCVVCDLITRGAGESRPGRAMASPDLERKAPSPGQRSSGLMESRRYPGG
jgi:hypothetical protein